MLATCTIVIIDEANTLQYGIRVKNFPEIAEGSCVDITLGDFLFEELRIQHYTASNIRGTQVHFSIDTTEPGAPITREKLMSLFDSEAPKNSGCEYFYGDVIDFNGLE